MWLRVCRQCGSVYPLRAENFRPAPTCANLRWVCRPCENAAYARRRDENRARYLANARRWRESHADQARAAARDSYHRRKEARSDELRIQWATKRAKRMSAPGSHTSRDIETQMRAQNERCYWCGRKLGAHHVDHVIPLSRGGSDGPENLVISCPSCNMSKGAKLPHEFVSQRAQLVLT